MTLKGLNLAGKLPTPKPKVVPKATPEFERIVEEETREADRLIHETDKLIEKSVPEARRVEPGERNISDENEKLSRLVEDDFPFDDTQLTAIYGLAGQQYGVMIGAAGTGKTTTTKKLVDILRDGLAEIDLSQYWQSSASVENDDYEVPEKLIPAMVMVAFTGRATQMIKKNFPRDWHGNIMTIHRALGFKPEFYEDFDPETESIVNKRRFVPTYTAENKMPWDIIIVDEAGMLGLDLWHQLWAATKPTARIILIGDINQLPPTHGKSILGFALGKWPTWELTHVHRQQGANNSIVDNAHRILNGIRPISDSPTNLSIKTPEQMLEALKFMANDKSWRFLTVEVDEDHRKASMRIRQVMQLLQGKLYEPNRDVIITPTNGFEQTAPGWSLGQQPLNQDLVIKLNSANPRYIIDAGREKQNFAIGDKVMATVNDYEAGITNGMTGIVTAITPHGGYNGDSNRWGLIDEVNAYVSGLEEDDTEVEFNLEEMLADAQANLAARGNEKRDGGPASHIVEVEFGEGDHAFKIAFSTKANVASLMLAYAATCHKMQGGECPHVFGIVHQAHARLSREWYYTMVTRASQRCVVFTTRMGTGKALASMAIKGRNLREKIEAFRALTKSGLIGASVNVRIPEPQSLGTDVEAYEPKGVLIHEEVKPEAAPASEPEGRPIPSIKIGALHLHIHNHAAAETSDRDGSGVGRVDGAASVRSGGSESSPLKTDLKLLLNRSKTPVLPPPAKLVSQWGAAQMAVTLAHAQVMSNRLLTHEPKPAPNPNKPRSLAEILGRK